ncbi:MFS transporter [Leeia aquatica]|uniref:MFS transporter n=1 Tax=Leeia aquatica TaxID=2725557 RepID=A0A847SLY1_9NEIS|nr:MFS transporter [Leeia aquatica]NLR76952.1 MFS transporter [Leeia aquatica]
MSEPRSLSQQVNERILLLLLCGVQFTHIVDFMIMMPLGPQLMRSMHITPAAFSFLVSSYAWSSALAGLVAGFLLDRFDRRQAHLVLYVGFILATVVCGVASDYWSLMIGRVLAGAFAGVMSAGTMAILVDVIPVERRGPAMGIVMGAFSLAAIIGVPFSLYLAAHWGWRVPFLAVAGFAVLMLLVAWQQLPSLRGHMGRAPLSLVGQLHAIFTPRHHQVAFALMSAVIVSGFLIIPFLSPSLVANVGVKESELPWVYIAGGIPTLFTAPLIGRWSDRFGAGKVFTLVALCAMPAMLLTTCLYGPMPLWLALLVSTSFMILVSGRFTPLMSLTSRVAEPHLRGSFMSFINVFRDLSSGAGAAIAGAILLKDDAGHLLRFPWVGALSMGVSLLAIMLALWLSRLLQAQVRA